MGNKYKEREKNNAQRTKIKQFPREKNTIKVHIVWGFFLEEVFGGFFLFSTHKIPPNSGIFKGRRGF